MDNFPIKSIFQLIEFYALNLICLKVGLFITTYNYLFQNFIYCASILVKNKILRSKFNLRFETQSLAELRLVSIYK